MEEKQPKLAILIDADNAQASILEELLTEIAKYGIATVKRIYGDWTTTRLRKWKEILLEYAIQPMQQFGYTTGKNATDSALIIDAMDLLYTEKLDGFCIVSSDSDFTRLALRIREAGLTVYGIGEKKTPQPFVAACNKFIYTEILREDDTVSQSKEYTTQELKKDTKLVNLLRSAVEVCADDSGWANLGSVGSNISKNSPEFDPRNFGYKKLGEIVRAISLFEINEVVSHSSPGKSIYIRDKRKRK